MFNIVLLCYVSSSHANLAFLQEALIYPFSNDPVKPNGQGSDLILSISGHIERSPLHILSHYLPFELPVRYLSSSTLQESLQQFQIFPSPS